MKINKILLGVFVLIFVTSCSNAPVQPAIFTEGHPSEITTFEGCQYVKNMEKIG